MVEEILSALSTRYHIKQMDLSSLDVDCAYKITKYSLAGELSFYLFVTNSGRRTLVSLKNIETLLEKIQKPVSILCVFPYGQKLEQVDKEVMMLFNEKFRSFVHFIYFDEKTCKYSTDFYYYGSREIKRAMKCIVQALSK